MFPKSVFLKSQKVVAVAEDGEFPCPACAADRPYGLIVTYEVYGFFERIRPSSRGDVAGILVECKTCGRRFPDELRDKTLFRDRESERELVKRLRENLLAPNGDQGSPVQQNPLNQPSQGN